MDSRIKSASDDHFLASNIPVIAGLDPAIHEEHAIDALGACSPDGAKRNPGFVSLQRVLS
jgi:hypothetical protein